MIAKKKVTEYADNVLHLKLCGWQAQFSLLFVIVYLGKM